jgi:hypothetical protein
MTSTTYLQNVVYVVSSHGHRDVAPFRDAAAIAQAAILGRYEGRVAYREASFARNAVINGLKAYVAGAVYFEQATRDAYQGLVIDFQSIPLPEDINDFVTA